MRNKYFIGIDGGATKTSEGMKYSDDDSSDDEEGKKF